jgi:hypothetical protein
MLSREHTFKLNLDSLVNLTSRGDNFTEWRTAWTIAFRFMLAFSESHVYGNAAVCAGLLLSHTATILWTPN